MFFNVKEKTSGKVRDGNKKSNSKQESNDGRKQMGLKGFLIQKPSVTVVRTHVPIVIELDSDSDDSDDSDFDSMGIEM